WRRDGRSAHFQDRVARHTGDAGQGIRLVKGDPRLVDVAREAFRLGQISGGTVGKIEDRHRGVRELPPQVDLELAVTFRRSQYQKGLAQAPDGEMKITVRPIPDL